MVGKNPPSIGLPDALNSPGKQKIHPFPLPFPCSRSAVKRIPYEGFRINFYWSSGNQQIPTCCLGFLEEGPHFGRYEPVGISSRKD